MASTAADPSIIDPSTEFDAYALERLQSDGLSWLVTITPSGRPAPNPIWHWWDGRQLLLLSQPDAAKVRHVTENPNVALHLQSTGNGGGIVVVNGTATVGADGGVADAEWAGYAAKYADGFTRIGLPAPEYRATYSTPIRVRPTGLRGFIS